MIQRLAVVLAWALAAACQSLPHEVCDDGRVCPGGTVCDLAHDRCVLPAQLDACAGRDALAPCALPGFAQARCYDGVCLPAGCGNGVVDPGEVCDDGNQDPGDRCSADCRSDESCGNARIDPDTAEQCDDGNDTPGDGCTYCRLPLCGDGTLDLPFAEVCDDGAANSVAPDAGCRPNCQPRRCGDAIVDAASGEVCDDGNLAGGDGCSAICLHETCGNGHIDAAAGENCDDGGFLDHDGCNSRCRLEEVSWTRWTPGAAHPDITGAIAVAYDRGRDRLVLFGRTNRGDGDTWEWDGDAWRPADAISDTPARRQQMSMSDAPGGVVLFGGLGERIHRDLWQWDGTSWRERATPGATPAPRRCAAMSFERQRGTVLLFGGIGADERPLADTWRWDGERWHLLAPLTSPPARGCAAMAHDHGRDRTVLFGGNDIRVRFGDTWEWDGSTWSLRSTTGPLGRTAHAMTYDARLRRVLVFGGDVATGAIGDLWAWDGATWTQLAPSGTAPRPVRFPGLAHDSEDGRTLLVGGEDRGLDTREVWSWTDTGWRRVEAAITMPPLRSSAPLAYDPWRGQLVLVGGADQSGSDALDDTWLWNGRAWREGPGAPGGRRYGHAMAPHAGTRTIVLFGGEIRTADGFVPRTDTARWDGATWSDATPPGDSPPPRVGHRMAHDPRRDRVVLYGGVTAREGEWLGDTWEWDGAAWHAMTPPRSPPPLYAPALAYDPVRGRVVLFGGSIDLGVYTDRLWEWDGATWTERMADGPSPIARDAAAFVYHPARRRLVLFGGNSSSGIREDTWELDGARWVRVPIVGPVRVSHHSGAYFAPTAELVVVGSPDEDSDTWRLRYEERRAPIDACRFGADTDGDALVGCDDPDCWAYCTPECPPMTSCPASAAACGDGDCNPALETCELCPGDCGDCP